MRQLVIVTASGQVIVASRRRNSAAFSAALCSLGTIGVVCAVTLQVVRDFEVRGYLSFPYPFFVPPARSS